MTPSLISKLRAHKIASARSQPHHLVFVSRDGTPLDHRNVGGRVLARAVRAAGIVVITDTDGEVLVLVPAPTFHALRHSHASALIAQGCDIEEVSARLGHASVAITQRIYIHQFDAARRSPERRARLAKLYEHVTDGTARGSQPSTASKAESTASAHRSGQNASR